MAFVPSGMRRLVTRRRLEGLLGTLSIPALGLAVGLGSAYWMVSSGPRFGSLAVGPWVAEPSAATIDADPYSLARRIRRAELVPLGSESLTFTATRDSAGHELLGNCDYVVAGASPPARVWTLTVLSTEGDLIDNPAGRHGFAGTELVRLGKQEVRITVSARARPGNWLPTDHRPFVLVLRLYDTAVGSGFGASRVAFPEIVREACR